MCFFFFSSRRRHTRCGRDWSSDVCSSDLGEATADEIWRVFEQPDLVRSGLAPARGEGAHRLERRQIEIGRASCRERGVDFGGGRIIKKKRNNSGLRRQ